MHSGPPWRLGSTPETQEEHDIRDEYEKAREDYYAADERVDEAVRKWHQWRRKQGE